MTNRAIKAAAVLTLVGIGVFFAWQAAQLRDATPPLHSPSSNAVPLGIADRLLDTLDTRKQMLPKFVKFHASKPEVTVTLAGRDGISRRIDAWRGTDYGPMMRFDGADLLHAITQSEYEELVRLGEGK